MTPILPFIPDADAVATLHLQLQALLPAAVARACASYHHFSTLPMPDDAKSFTAHHNACKAALSHLAALARLIKLLDGPRGKSTHAADAVTTWMQAARATLAEEHSDENQF